MFELGELEAIIERRVEELRSVWQKGDLGEWTTEFRKAEEGEAGEYDLFLVPPKPYTDQSLGDEFKLYLVRGYDGRWALTAVKYDSHDRQDGGVKITQHRITGRAFFLFQDIFDAWLRDGTITMWWALAD